MNYTQNSRYRLAVVRQRQDDCFVVKIPMLGVQCADRPQSYRGLGFDALPEKTKRTVSKGRRRNVRQQFSRFEFRAQKPDDSFAREREPKVFSALNNINQKHSAKSRLESSWADLLARRRETAIGEFLPSPVGFNQVLAYEIRRGFEWARRSRERQVFHVRITSRFEF